jgi:hypothetical protein
MNLDQNLMFADAMSLVGATGTYKGDRSLKFQTPQAIPPFTETGGPHDYGMGRNVDVLCKIGTACDSAGGTGTIKAQLVMADDENLATNPLVIGSSEAIGEDTAVAGYEFRTPCKIPPGTTKYFLGVQFVTAGEALTAGTVTATLTPFDRDDAAFV